MINEIKDVKDNNNNNNTKPIMKVLGTPTYEQMKAMNGKIINSSKMPKNKSKTLERSF